MHHAAALVMMTLLQMVLNSLMEFLMVMSPHLEAMFILTVLDPLITPELIFVWTMTVMVTFHSSYLLETFSW